MNNTIYLASQSSARHNLLRQAAIPFVVIPTGVCEEDAVVTGTVHEQVRALAKYKHSGIDVPAIVEQHAPDHTKPLFFLSGDTLIAGARTGSLYGKPRDHSHAKQMVRELGKQPIEVVTGMCLSVWHYDVAKGCYAQTSYDVWDAGAECIFRVDEDMIDEYLHTCSAAMYACGAIAVEEIGVRFFSEIRGSYTGTLGIDLYTLCQKLREYGFWG